MKRPKKKLIDKVAATTKIGGKLYHSVVQIKIEQAVQICWLDMETGEIVTEFRWPSGQNDYTSKFTKQPNSKQSPQTV